MRVGHLAFSVHFVACGWMMAHRIILIYILSIMFILYYFITIFQRKKPFVFGGFLFQFGLFRFII